MKKVFLCLLLFAAACTTVTPPHDFIYQEVPTSTFKIATWYKITNPSPPVKVYVEGDGAAFRANGQISSNPTPRGVLVRELAFGDTHANVIYLARPCQFTKDDKCAPQYWSTARFAPEIIQAEYEALHKLAGNNPLTLVGFSGGAQVAGLLAVKYPDLKVQKLVTIAGNLDHKAWTTYHHLPALELSDALAHYRQQYLAFEQVHYVGAEDDNIVPSITENFVGNKSHIIYIKNANHSEGWQKVYSQIWAE